MKPPKKYMLNTAALVEGGPEDYNEYSYSVYVDLNKLKEQLKQIFKKNPIPGQPVNKKGKPYNYFVYEQAVVNVDDMENVREVQQQLIGMASRPAAVWTGWNPPEAVQHGSGRVRRNRSRLPVRSRHRNCQYHDDVHLRENQGDRRSEGAWLRHGQYQKHVSHRSRVYRFMEESSGCF